jgi:hypothetical protein
VSVPTITEWLSILEITGLVALVPPYFESFGKRLRGAAPLGPPAPAGGEGLAHGEA